MGNSSSLLYCQSATVSQRSFSSSQRRIAFLICRGYRTISSPALMVLARFIPWKFTCQERTEIFKNRLGKTEARLRTMTLWQKEWDYPHDHRALWTKSLIKNIEPWFDRSHGELTYHLTQCLSGHGCFGEYLFRMRKVSSPNCQLCDECCTDSVDHTLGSCPYFKVERDTLNSILSRPFQTVAMCTIMLEDPSSWNLIQNFVSKVMRKKERQMRSILARGLTIEHS